MKKHRKPVARKKSAQTRTPKGSVHNYPVTETLQWIRDGHKLLKKWGAIKSPVARRVARAGEKILTMLETVDEIRKM